MGRKTPSYGEIPDFRLRLVETSGWGFALGAAFGSAFHFQMGFRRSPNCGRIATGAHAVRANGLRAAGSIASFNALFFASERAMSLAHHREDHWNSIAAAAATCGIRKMRHGPHDAVLSALLGASLMALVNCAGICFDSIIAVRSLDPSPPPLAGMDDDLGLAARQQCSIR